MILIKKLAEKFPYFWFFFLIMAYPIQVCFSTTFFSYFIYLASIIYIGFYFIKNKINIIDVSIIDKLMIIFITLIIFNLFREFYSYYDIHNFIRTSALYVVPILFVYIFIYAKDSFEIRKFYLFVGTAIIIIALELIYEFFHSEISWFEKLNFDYVYEISSLKLEQLLGPLRNNGLMDHIHVTAIFISFGIIMTVSSYLCDSKNEIKILNLFILLILYVSFLLIGVRLILIYLHIWLLLIFTFGAVNIKIKIIKLHFLFALIFFILCLFTFSFKPYFWSAIYLQYLPKEFLDYFQIYEFVSKLAYQNDSIENFRNMDVNFFGYTDSINIMNLIFGTGFGEIHKKEGFLNDDLYVLELLSSLGLLNSIIFIIISFITLKNIVINLFLNKNMIILFGFFLVILLSMSHSGIFIRKQVFPFFFFSIFMIDFYIKKLKINIRKENNINLEEDLV